MVWTQRNTERGASNALGRHMEKLARLTEMYSQQFNSLVGRVSRRVGNRTNGEDVVQEAMMKAITYIDSLGVDQPIEPWFNTILNNSAKDFKKQDRLDGMSKEEATTEPADDTHIREEFIGQLSEELEAIKEPDRTALKGVLIHDWKPGEVAQYSPMSANHIRVVLFNFKKKMKEKYGEEMYEDMRS